MSEARQSHLESRRSLYRPVRRARINHGVGWQCISIQFSLVKVVIGCTVVDFIRSIFDTSILLVLLVYTMDLDYDDVILASRRRSNTYRNRGEDDSATTYASLSRGEYARLFSHTRTLCIILGITACLVVIDIPLAIFLFKAVKNQDRTKLSMWTQISICFIFFNFVCFSGIIVYSGKAGLILDNTTWVTSTGANLQGLIYLLLLRTAIFDLTKGAEVVVVNAFSKELSRRKKAVSHTEHTA